MMRRTGTKIAIIGFFIIILGVVDADAIVGTQWKQLPADGKQGYIMGVVDSWNTLRNLKDLTKQKSPSVGDLMTEIAECAGGRFTYEQIMEIVEKHMADNPAGGNYEMPSIIWTALSPVCKATKN
jgi:hypothetical protein